MLGRSSNVVEVLDCYYGGVIKFNVVDEGSDGDTKIMQ